MTVPDKVSDIVSELVHALAWIDQEMRELKACGFSLKEAKAQRALAAVKAALAALAAQAVPAQPSGEPAKSQE